MFGKIIDINENILTVENLKGAPESQILNYHVVFTENDRKIVGEIIGMNSQVIKIMLIGEIRNDIFTSGVSKKPTYQTGCRIITKKELESIIGSQDINHRQTLLIGTSNTYENLFCTVLKSYIINYLYNIVLAVKLYILIHKILMPHLFDHYA